MTERPDQPGETPDFLAKPVSPSGEQPSAPPPPPYGGEPTSPYVTQSGPGFPGQPGMPGEPPGGYAPYGAPPPGYPGYPFAQAHGGANVAMGLGITSLVCAVATFFCCVTIPGVLTGPFAIALAMRARTEMRQSPGLYNNESAATTGLVTGIIGTVLGVVMVGLVLFVFGFVFAVGDQ